MSSVTSSPPPSEWQVSTSDTNLLNVYLAGTTLDGQMFGFNSAFTSTKIMIAKMEVSAAGDVSIYTWAKAYCIECALENLNWSGTVSVKDIKSSSTGLFLYLAV